MGTIGSTIIGGKLNVRQTGEFVPLCVNKREFSHLKTPNVTIISVGASSYIAEVEEDINNNIDEPDCSDIEENNN